MSRDMGDRERYPELRDQIRTLRQMELRIERERYQAKRIAKGLEGSFNRVLNELSFVRECLVQELNDMNMRHEEDTMTTWFWDWRRAEGYDKT